MFLNETKMREMEMKSTAIKTQKAETDGYGSHWER